MSLRSFVLLAWLLSVVLPGSAEARRRRPCAGNGMSCTPGPCCKGTKCDESGVCRQPEKEWSDGPKPGEWTPDHPKPLKKDEPKKK